MEDPSRLVQLEPSTMPLFGRKVFADVIKDLDMGSFRLRAAQINDECLYKRQTRRDANTGRGHRRMEAETGAAPRQELLGTSSPAGTGREAWSSFSRGFRGVDFQPLELGENRFLFEAPGWWSLVPAAPGPPTDPKAACRVGSQCQTRDLRPSPAPSRLSTGAGRPSVRHLDPRLLCAL